MNLKSKYLSGAFLLVLTSVIVKIIGAVYKIPLTAFIGAVGRGYFAAAYNLCLPIHAVTMGAFPIALSGLVGKYNAGENEQKIYALRKGSLRLFSVAGFVGMAVMLLLSKPYSVFIAHSPKSIYTILVLAPSVLFSCLASSYRGYYEGFLNMAPTSVSQTIEALFKMIFGLAFARISMSLLYKSYLDNSSVLGTVVTSDEQALSVIYPLTSAAAMLGVTLGSLVSLLYVFIYHSINKSPVMVLPSSSMVKESTRELASFSLPIMISSAVQSVFQFIDTATVQYSLGNMNKEALRRAYSACIIQVNVADNDLVTYVYGLLSTALDFKNLIPGITMALGVCAVPAISRACELGDGEKLSSLVNSIYKYTLMLSSFGGIMLALFSSQLLSIFYSSTSKDIVDGCSDLVRYFAFTVVFYCLAGTAVFCVQAIGCPERSIAPYVASGIIRCVLNLCLVSNERLILKGCVISGAVGYSVMAVWNIFIVKRAKKIKLRLVFTFFKPLFVAVITYFAADKLIISKIFCSNELFNLLIEFALTSSIFCILCLVTKTISIKDISGGLNCKKMA